MNYNNIGAGGVGGLVRHLVNLKNLMTLSLHVSYNEIRNEGLEILGE